jgi:general secretion pathway protein G
MNRRTHRRGFTLIELLLVLVILAVLAGVALPVYFGQAKEAKVKATKASLSNIKSQLANFEIEFDRFPTTEEGLAALVSNPGTLPNWNHPFMDKMPKDGFGQEFQYRFPGNGQLYDLYSIGPDGQDGTADDISVWADQ